MNNNNNNNINNNNNNNNNIIKLNDNSLLFFKCWRNNYIKLNILNQIPLKYTKIKKYYELHSVEWILKVKLYGLLEDKVKMNQYLTFNKTFKLSSLFNVFRENQLFYENLLKNYKAHFIHLNDVCEEACLCGNILALNVFLNDKDFKPQKSLIDIAIREGNITLLKYLFQHENQSLKEYSKKEILNNIFEEREFKDYNQVAYFLINEINIDLEQCMPYQFDTVNYLKCDSNLFNLLYSNGLIIVDQNSLSFKCMENIFEYSCSTLKKYIEFLLFILSNKLNINVSSLYDKLDNLNLNYDEMDRQLSKFDENHNQVKKLIELLIFDIQDICSFRFQNHGSNEIHYAIKYNDLIYLRNLNQKVKQKGIDITLEYGNSEALLEITSSQVIVYNNSTINNSNSIPTLFKYCSCREKQRIYLQTFLYHVNCVAEKDYLFKLALVYDDLEIIQFIHHLMLIYGVFSNKPKKIISSDMLQYVQSVKVLTYLCQNKKDFQFNFTSLLKRERFDLMECFERFDSIISKNDTSLLNEADLSLNSIKYLNEKGYSCTYKAYYNSRKSIEKYKYLVDNRSEKYSYSDLSNNQNSWILLNYIYEQRKDDIISKRFEIDNNFFNENVIFLYYSNNHDQMFKTLSSNMDLSPILLKEFAKKCDIEIIDKYMSLYFPNSTITNYKHHLIHLLEPATKCGHIGIFKLLQNKYSFIFKGEKGNSHKLNCLHESRLIELTLIAMEYNYLDLFIYFIDEIKLIPNQFQMLLQLRLRPSNSIKYHYLKRYQDK